MSRIRFRDQSNRLGPASTGESYGAAWGDFNGDGWVDLWSPNHHSSEKLLINQKNGKFKEVGSGVILSPKNVDPHGSAWADFDNDGRQDLAQSIGGAFGRDIAQTESQYFNQLFVNRNGKLKDRALSLGVADPGGRGRSPLWLDFDGDGLLDLILANGVKDLEDVSADEQTSTKLFRQTKSGFEDVTGQSGFNFDHARYGILADLNNDGNLELVFSSISRVFDISEYPFRDITSTLFPGGIIPRHRDSAPADFNGDLKTDLFLAKEELSSDYYQSSPTQARVLFRQAKGKEHGVSFKTESPGGVTFRFRSPHYNFSLQPDEVFIGSNGVQPNRFKQNDSFIEFTLRANNAWSQGIQSHSRGQKNGLYIGFLPETKTWEVYWSNGLDDSLVIQPIALIKSSTELSDLSPLNFVATRDKKKNKNVILFNQGDDQFVRQNVGGTLPGSASSVVAADFDNDMDIDAYVVNTGAIANIPNIYYENLGDGTFKPRKNLGDAVGSTLGVGESVVASDYDQDGFVDLYVTNGRNILGPWFHENSSPNQLFKNLGNDNNWIQLKLTGTTSNRDAIGSRVILTAGGTSQLREQNNGAHTFAQNDKLLHFGLGQNTKVESIKVDWRSGASQLLRNVNINQILEVLEGQGTDRADVIVGSSQRDVLIGKNGDDRLSGNLQDDVLMGGMGKDRLSGGGGDDILTGGQGLDRLMGGRGADIFVLDDLTSVDSIQDFKVRTDQIHIASQQIDMSLPKGFVSSANFRLGMSAQYGSDRFLYDRSTGNLLFDPDGRGGEATILVASLENTPALRYSDIRII